MNCAILGRVVDVFETSFTGKDSKEVKYHTISVVDEDAFLDSDRIMALRVTKPEVAKGVEAGKSYKFRGVLTTDRGLLRFKVKEVELSK